MKNNYDDLQRFKEKTQTLDIDFKDMSGQTQEAAEHSKWALIRQLAKEEQQTPFGSGQRIDLPQPQPLRGDEFTAPPPELPVRPATLSAQPAMAARTSILDSLSGSNMPAASKTERGPSSLFPPPLLEKVAEAVPRGEPAAMPRAERVRPATVADLQPVIPPAPSHSEPERFGALFRSRDTHLPKETLLKPLLEKIALCR
ncbi:cellulose biosynthesis protein BcsO [Pantoea sp. GD03673]|uniref:cellulose biosynthesis protein BcsO n=1 Tax=Pantoea sp. GD03673 TaxID=2975364 RepID=UPI00244D0D1B|nr:cellulose biosynthesis protein BcsO [Pantoea sp. GD03673]MDH2068846.1 cellulose biosynthesis protein BcsO [Pantoea sp. GD03673]